MMLFLERPGRASAFPRTRGDTSRFVFDPTVAAAIRRPGDRNLSVFAFKGWRHLARGYAVAGLCIVVARKPVIGAQPERPVVADLEHEDAAGRWLPAIWEKRRWENVVGDKVEGERLAVGVIQTIGIAAVDAVACHLDGSPHVERVANFRNARFLT